MLDPISIGALVSAGSSLVGGFLGRESQEDQRAKNEALQREFAQNSVQWRVADAKKAGIHPLYAMGAPTMSPSVGVQADPLASSISSMGADIGRAMSATANPAVRATVTSTALQDLQLQNMTLRNDLLASQIRKLNQAGTPPGIPIGDAVDAGNETKIEKNARVIMDGEEIIPDPGYSPTKVLADQYGDENPAVQWIYGPYKMWRDFTYNREMRVPHKDHSRGTSGGRGGGGW